MSIADQASQGHSLRGHLECGGKRKLACRAVAFVEGGTPLLDDAVHGVAVPNLDVSLCPRATRSRPKRRFRLYKTASTVLDFNQARWSGGIFRSEECAYARPHSSDGASSPYWGRAEAHPSEQKLAKRQESRPFCDVFRIVPGTNEHEKLALKARFRSGDRLCDYSTF